MKLALLSDIHANIQALDVWLATIGSVGQLRDGNPLAMYALTNRRYDNGRMLSLSPNLSGLHAFEALTPDGVMDAMASVGLYGDGRQLALSSYENRVYQLHLEDGPRWLPSFTARSAGARRRFWRSMLFPPN